MREDNGNSLYVSSCPSPIVNDFWLWRMLHCVPFSQITRIERLGVTVTIRSGVEAEIKAQLDLGHPLIYPVLTQQLDYWNEASAQHAITVIGYDSDFLFINDPAFDQAPQQIGWIELLLACEVYDYAFATITR